ncbi:MAG: GyrI-like domain-containing protein [Actinomycetota bacterium]|nr:GyrI-like domain-containing protein [Actinomycetota bacterium]
MNLTIQIEDRSLRPYVGIPTTVDLAHFWQANALIPQVYDWLTDHAVEPAGGPTYRYMSIGSRDETMDMSVNVPVARPVEATQGLVPGSLPAGRYVVGTHQGSPDEIAAVHAALRDWARQEHLALAMHTRAGREFWDARAESYLTDPRTQPDMSKWQNEVVYLIANES